MYLVNFKKKAGYEVVWGGRGFTLFISNEDMDDFLKLVELLEISGLLVNVAFPMAVPSDLNYSYCSYKTIELSIAPVSHEV